MKRRSAAKAERPVSVQVADPAGASGNGKDAPKPDWQVSGVQREKLPSGLTTTGDSLTQKAVFNKAMAYDRRLQSKLTISTQFASFPEGYLPISFRAPLESSIA